MKLKLILLSILGTIGFVTSKQQSKKGEEKDLKNDLQSAAGQHGLLGQQGNSLKGALGHKGLGGGGDSGGYGIQERGKGNQQAYGHGLDQQPAPGSHGGLGDYGQGNQKGHGLGNQQGGGLFGLLGHGLHQSPQSHGSQGLGGGYGIGGPRGQGRGRGHQHSGPAWQPPLIGIPQGHQHSGYGPQHSRGLGHGLGSQQHGFGQGYGRQIGGGYMQPLSHGAGQSYQQYLQSHGEGQIQSHGHGHQQQNSYGGQQGHNPWQNIQPNLGFGGSGLGLGQQGGFGHGNSYQQVSHFGNPQQSHGSWNSLGHGGGGYQPPPPPQQLGYGGYSFGVGQPQQWQPVQDHHLGSHSHYDDDMGLGYH